MKDKWIHFVVQLVNCISTAPERKHLKPWDFFHMNVSIVLKWVSTIFLTVQNWFFFLGAALWLSLWTLSLDSAQLALVELDLSFRSRGQFHIPWWQWLVKGWAMNSSESETIAGTSGRSVLSCVFPKLVKTYRRQAWSFWCHLSIRRREPAREKAQHRSKQG